MKSSHGLLILFVIAGVYISSLPSDDNPAGKELEEVDAFITTGKVEIDPPVPVKPELVYPASLLPGGAIPGEYVIHFTDRNKYLEYLEALSSVGLEPLGRIDSLLSLRLDESTLTQLNPVPLGGNKRFSYYIKRPLPPAEINPELLAQLHGFGQSARTIAGGLIDGDGSGILVGILDSGIEDHSCFENVTIDSIDLTGKGASGAGTAHGTAVASIVAGTEGIAPAADLLVIRVLDDQGVGSSFDVAAGIVHAVDLGAQIINLSLGVYQDTQILHEAVRYAQSQEVILVAAAGNEGYSQLPYPAAYPEVLSVTAVDGRGRQAVFPNQSRSIDFAAPGVGIVAATEEGKTQSFSGTSAAVPFVSGTLAALLSADSTLSSQEAVTLIEHYLDEAGAAGPDPVYGSGVLNLDRLRERTMDNINDIALADIYLQPDAQPGTTMPIEVTVQNRGTTWLNSGKLTILVSDSVPNEFTVGTLAPGQTTTRKIHTQIPAIYSEETLQIGAHILAEDSSNDVRPENNMKVVFLRPVQR